MKMAVNTEGMVSGPSLYQRLAEKYKKASITLYKTAQREQLFKCNWYTTKGGRLEYWFTPAEAILAERKFDEYYSKRRKK